METQVTRILLVEDNPVDAELVRRKLERELQRRDWFRLDHVGVLQEALDRLGKRSHDVILLDLHLPDSDGIGTVERVREVDPAIPLVVFTAAGDEEMAVRALRAGAQDYLVKDEIAGGRVLHRAIRYAIERMRIGEEKRVLQERLHQAEKLQSLGVLAAGTAFGFNTLLGAILEQAERGLEVPRLAEPTRDGLHAIRRTSLRAAHLAAQLRDYALTDSGEMISIELSPFVMDASQTLDAIAGPGVSIDYHLASDLPALRGNPLELRQLLVNLVLNATEAIEEPEGFISIRTGSRWLDRPFLSETQGASDLEPGRYVALRVGDSGRGLDAQTRARLFDPFYTTKFAGRGLGLAAAFGIVRRHGGAIHVEAAEGGGAAFEVFFPALDRT